jgi:hypothetical protein
MLPISEEFYYFGNQVRDILIANAHPNEKKTTIGGAFAICY